MELSKKMYYLRWLLLTEYIPSVPTLKTEYKLLLSVIRLERMYTHRFPISESIVMNWLG